MPFTITLNDFLIGFLLMGAMPYMLFGLMNIRFLSLFGFSGFSSLLQAMFNIGVALYCYHLQYQIVSILTDGVMIGAFAMMLLFLILGRFLLGAFELN